MATIRVYELAKEMNMNSKVLLDQMIELGLPMKNHMSTIPRNEVNRIKAMVLKHMGDPSAEHIPRPAEKKTKPPLSGLKPRQEAQPQARAGEGSAPAAQAAPAPAVQASAAQIPAERITAQAGSAPGSEQAGQSFTPSQAGFNPGQTRGGQQSRPAQPGGRQSSGQRPQGQNAHRQDQRPQSQGAGNFADQGGGQSGQRPQGQNAHRQGQRPQGQNAQGQGQRPQSQNVQGQSQRPQGQNVQGQSAAGQNHQGQGPRPQGQGQRPQGQGPRPQGQGQRPQGQGPRPQGQSQRPQGQGQRPLPGQNAPAGQRPGGRPQGQNQNQKYAGSPGGQNQQKRRPGSGGQGFKGPNTKGPVIRKDTADHLTQIVSTTEEDSGFLNKVESAVGDKAYDRGGIAKTPNRKQNRYEDNRKNKGGKFGRDRKYAQPKPEPAPVVVKNITLDRPVTVVEFAHLMNRKSGEVIKKLMGLGVMATLNQELDMDTLILLGQEFGTAVEAKVTKEDILSAAAEEPDDPKSLKERPPVVTIMGHVDHGKTSLLDSIRKANVQASEAGGITQHIGAYQVEINNRKITFLDTPGHEAFTAMRARGAQCTDIAVLVVAADDGVMPQTIEAINHSKAAGVPIIVAVNKIDKEGANPERVKQELTEHGLVAEDWGGDTIFVEVSAKTKTNIDQLLEMILLVADMGDLKANPNRKAKGVVIEAKLDKGRGPVATVLVQNGTLEAGDFVIIGTAQGRIRAMNDERGRQVKKALPSMPVEIIGLSEVPQAGDIFQVVDDERLAKQIASERTAVKREEVIHSRARISLDDLFTQIQTGEVKDLNIIIKADVQGSIEALKQSLEKLSNDEVRVNIIHQGVGGITETDVDFAAASDAIILGFNVRPDVNARKSAENQQVDVRLYNVIYNAIEDVKSALSGLLKPELRENVIGRAEVRQIIKVPKVGAIAGSYILEGKITRGCQVRVVRGGIVIHEGSLGSLRRFKDDVKEVATGFECGIGLERFNEFEIGDQIEAYVMEEIKRELS